MKHTFLTRFFVLICFSCVFSLAVLLAMNLQSKYIKRNTHQCYATKDFVVEKKMLDDRVSYKFTWEGEIINRNSSENIKTNITSYTWASIHVDDVFSDLIDRSLLMKMEDIIIDSYKSFNPGTNGSYLIRECFLESRSKKSSKYNQWRFIYNKEAFDLRSSDYPLGFAVLFFTGFLLLFFVLAMVDSIEKCFK